MQIKRKKGRITVIIPAHNAVEWIGDCIRSVQEQSWEDLEILILDDNSGDGTARLVQKMAEKDDRIRYLCLQQNGVSFARNQGIETATGEYLTFVDADDRIRKFMLELLVRCLEKEESQIAMCGFQEWNPVSGIKAEQGDVSESFPKEFIERMTACSREEFLSDHILKGDNRCWSILYRYDAVDKVRFREDLKIGEDMMFLMDLLPNLDRVVLTEYQGYEYRINEKGVMLRPFTPSYMDEIKSWKLAEALIEREYPDQTAAVRGILVVAAILTAGKLAALPHQERRKNRNYVEVCRETARQALRTPGVKKKLPKGYGMKAAAFLASPDLYLCLYHFWKHF